MGPRLTPRNWVPTASEALVQRVAGAAAAESTGSGRARLDELVDENRTIHELDCINLNPAANVMSPAAEALLATSLGSRPSLGHPGAKYEMGLEAVEQIEIIAAELAAEVFDAPFAEVRIGSGALANLYAFMACCEPGDSIIVPPGSIAGHVTHNSAGAAGLYRLDIHEAPVDADNYTVDVDALRALARDVRPRMITIGSSLNLTHHPVAAVREIADEVGATVLFDAAHLSGLIAGGAWPNPLVEGAHIMTMSTYKSLGGPPAGLLVTTEATIAERVDAIAFPGLTANFDAANTAALAVTLLDWQTHGREHARTMVDTASALAAHLIEAGLPVVTIPDGSASLSHAFAVRADATAGDGHALARHLRKANLLASGIGLPADPHGAMRAIRLGTNEMVRWGMAADDMAFVGTALHRALRGDDLAAVAADVGEFRRRFDHIHFCD
ncbi:serine hydroxymethyltransferase [Ilumatobacter nonamiensis]|uniref:serine hydroxymethyltransferase n=1 Tax=Ilumatobacter nonamiensis TaxID=467093 RepID=UPI00034A00CA|nr:aminotransferase class I/II-fold pyridoxal phosphate-dependent enzyme [Ilumatobacter nonamiensis]